jgi:hypothetical protein
LFEPVQHADWTRVLDHAEFAINNAEHSTTGVTPAELLFGVPQRGTAVDRLTEHLLERQPKKDRDVIKDRMDAARRIEKKQAETTHRFTTKYRPARKYIVGDYVVIRNVDNTPGCNKKFIPTFRGPYVVHKVLGNDRYVIRDVENCQRTQLPYDGILEAGRMRLWVDAGENDNDICDDGSTFCNRSHIPLPPLQEEDDLEKINTDETTRTVDGGGGENPTTKIFPADNAARMLRPLPHRLK